MVFSLVPIINLGNLHALTTTTVSTVGTVGTNVKKGKRDIPQRCWFGRYWTIHQCPPVADVRPERTSKLTTVTIYKLRWFLFVAVNTRCLLRDVNTRTEMPSRAPRLSETRNLSASKFTRRTNSSVAEPANLPIGHNRLMAAVRWSTNLAPCAVGSVTTEIRLLHA